MPWPTARNAVPMAAVVLPLPGPVFTIISPRRMSCIPANLLIVPVPERCRRECATLMQPKSIDTKEEFGGMETCFEGKRSTGSPPVLETVL